jgi:AI-2 transport protein TqsA
MKLGIAIIAAVLVIAAVSVASTVFAPLALSLFIIALIWPVQDRLQARMPKLAVLAISLAITLAVGIAFASLAAWSFGRVGRALLADAGRYQSLYEKLAIWLDGYGVSIAGLWVEHFNVSWLLRTTQYVTGRVNTALSFWLIALLYTTLGLLEVDTLRCKIEALQNRKIARMMLDGTATAAARIRRYMLVRTQMSVLTGVFVGAFTWVMGLHFAMEWAVIAFSLNYVPFVGPFIATLFPTLLAMTHFNSWEAVLTVFICLNAIQFVIGSYIEPRICGSMLSISPSVVLFATLFWTYMWGLFGTFIGVPIALAILSFCAQNGTTRWVADLLDGSKEKAA